MRNTFGQEFIDQYFTNLSENKSKLSFIGKLCTNSDFYNVISKISDCGLDEEPLISDEIRSNQLITIKNNDLDYTYSSVLQNSLSLKINDNDNEFATILQNSLSIRYNNLDKC